MKRNKPEARKTHTVLIFIHTWYIIVLKLHTSKSASGRVS